MSNYSIRDCQIALLNAERPDGSIGYDVGPDGADNEFGGGTQGALLQFQADHGLNQTGRFDKPTLALLFPNPKGTIMNNIIGSVFSGLFANLLNWQLIQGYLRNALTALGGVLVTNGMLTSTELNTVVGALMIIASVTFTALSNNTKKKAMDVVKAADRAPDVTVIPATETTTGKPIVTASK